MTKPKQKQISPELREKIWKLCDTSGPSRHTEVYVDRLRKIRELLEGVK